MQQILEMVTFYGLEAVILAMIVCILTGILKMPIKALAMKLKDYTKVTRFIVFLPIALGFLMTFCYAYYCQGGFIFDKAFATLWLTSSSLSLTFYAIFEKVFPSKKKLLREGEIKAGEKILDSIRQLVERFLPERAKNEIGEKEEVAIEEAAQETQQLEKIVLRGNVNAKVELEK